MERPIHGVRFTAEGNTRDDIPRLQTHGCRNSTCRHFANEHVFGDCSIAQLFVIRVFGIFPRHRNPQLNLINAVRRFVTVCMVQKDIVCNPFHDRERNGKVDVLIRPVACVGKPDQLALAVEQTAARIAVIDKRVRTHNAVSTRTER